MRLFISALVFGILLVVSWEPLRPASWSQRNESSVSFYDPSPTQVWNRLHAVIFIREDLPGTELIPDALDPPLWDNTQYLLTKPSHERVRQLCDTQALEVLLPFAPLKIRFHTVRPFFVRIPSVL